VDVVFAFLPPGGEGSLPLLAEVGADSILAPPISLPAGDGLEEFVLSSVPPPYFLPAGGGFYRIDC